MGAAVADFPDYFIASEPLDLAPSTEVGFDALLASAGGGELSYSLAAPKWQFLCWACDRHDVVLHGTGDPSITLFEPNQPIDATEFGSRKAVFAASDGIWPIYFAILDRQRYAMSLNNAAVRRRHADGSSGAPHYFFSISAQALAQRPFRAGWVYLLPRESFVPQPPLREPHGQIEVLQWASPVAVRPLARLAVEPADFPYLAQLRGHDDAVIAERARANPAGFPWLD